MMEAAKFQKVRRREISPDPSLQKKRRDPGSGLDTENVVKRTAFFEKEGLKKIFIHPADLRSHRRAPASEHLLALLIDYTSLRDCRWQEALMPHLRRAYIDRAAVQLIQVGAADAGKELCARRISARNLLAPRINEALNIAAGRAITNIFLEKYLQLKIL